MHNKFLSITALIFFSFNVFSVSIQAAARDNDRNISLYPPTGRLGFEACIQPETIELSSTILDGPSSLQISFGSVTPNVLKGSMVFDHTTAYQYSEEQRTYDFQGRFPVRKRWVSHSPTENQQIKQRISAYATACLTYEMYKDICAQIGAPYALVGLKLTINSHDVDTECQESPHNAYYQPTASTGGQGTLNFCAVGLDTVQFFDAIAHETGHAIFDCLNRGLKTRVHVDYDRYLEEFSHEEARFPQKEPKEFSDLHPINALDESFGDLSAIFSSLELAKRLGRTQNIIEFLGGNGEIFIAHGWPNSICRGTCTLALREPIFQSPTSCEIHINSNAFTRFFCNSMRRTFQDERAAPPELSRSSLAECTISHFLKLLVTGVCQTKGFDSLGNFARYICQMVPDIFPRSDRIFIKTVNNSLKREFSEGWQPLSSCQIPS